MAGTDCWVEAKWLQCLEQSFLDGHYSKAYESWGVRRMWQQSIPLLGQSTFAVSPPSALQEVLTRPETGGSEGCAPGG